MSAARARFVPLACALLAQACGEERALAPAFELADVVQARVAALEAEVRADEPAASDAPAPEELREHVRGLASEMERAQGRWRETLRADAAEIGAPAVPLLAASLADPDAPPARRAGLLELLGAIDRPAAAERLLAFCEAAPEPWVRRAAAFQLAGLSQDWVVPRLLLRLKYEVDAESVVWIAHALARFGNHAGLDGLFTLASEGPAEVRALAAQRLAEEARAAGLATPEELWRAWNGPAARELPCPPPSARHRLLLWRLVAELSGEHFQLRGVDDARFVLSRGAAWVGDLLCEALFERDVWTRVHVAQCLERMGPRAIAAGPLLRAALADEGVAAAAAAALGAIADPQAVGPLSAALAPERDPELRSAAARALGRIGLEPALRPLRALVRGEEPADLRTIAAASLVALGAGDEVAPFLLEELERRGADPALAEDALERWLALRAERGHEGSAARLERWRALAQAAPSIPSTAEIDARRAARAALAREELSRSK